MAEINGYNLSKAWFEFAWENNSRVKPTHTALFFWCVELWNRLGQPKEFGLPSSEARTAMSISRSDVFTGCLSDLKEWGFIEIVHQSINQHKANIIKICPIQIVEGNDQALRRATSKQRVSNVESNVDVNKHKNIEPINKEIDTNVSIKKVEAKESSKHNFSKSPFYELSAFEQEFIRLGDIKMPDKKIKPTEIDIEYYWNSAMDYGVDISHKYANWVIAVRSWIRNAPQRNKQIIYKKVEQFKEIYSNLPPPPKIETKTAEQIHEEAMRHINGYDN